MPGARRSVRGRRGGALTWPGVSSVQPELCGTGRAGGLGQWCGRQLRGEQTEEADPGPRLGRTPQKAAPSRAAHRDRLSATRAWWTAALAGLSRSPAPGRGDAELKAWGIFGPWWFPDPALVDLPYLWGGRRVASRPLMGWGASGRRGRERHLRGGWFVPAVVLSGTRRAALSHCTSSKPRKSLDLMACPPSVLPRGRPESPGVLGVWRGSRQLPDLGALTVSSFANGEAVVSVRGTAALHLRGQADGTGWKKHWGPLRPGCLWPCLWGQGLEQGRAVSSVSTLTPHRGQAAAGLHGPELWAKHGAKSFPYYLTSSREALYLGSVGTRQSPGGGERLAQGHTTSKVRRWVSTYAGYFTTGCQVSGAWSRHPQMHRVEAREAARRLLSTDGPAPGNNPHLNVVVPGQ